MKSKRGFPMPAYRSNRRGTVLIVAMICTLLASVILGTLLKIAVTGQRQSRVRENALQASWLAESGIERAASRLAEDPDYSGETWQIPATEFGGAHAGTVRIDIQPIENHADRKVIAVRADYPAGKQQRVRKSKHVEYHSPSKSPGDPGS